jgi:hypothetical protein
MTERGRLARVSIVEPIESRLALIRSGLERSAPRTAAGISCRQRPRKKRKGTSEKLHSAKSKGIFP